MTKEELKSLLENLIERAEIDSKEKSCACRNLPENCNHLLELALHLWSSPSPEPTLHVMINLYLVGRKIAEEEMLNILTGVKQ